MMLNSSKVFFSKKLKGPNKKYISVFSDHYWRTRLPMLAMMIIWQYRKPLEDRAGAWSFKAAGIYLLQVNNWNTTTRCEICSKLAIKTLASFWCLYYQLWTNFILCSSVSILNFEHVIGGWEGHYGGQPQVLGLNDKFSLEPLVTNFCCYNEMWKF